MPPAVALLNYISCGILWRISWQTGIFAGFSLYIIDRKDQRSCGAGNIIFFRVPRSSFTRDGEIGDGEIGDGEIEEGGCE